MPELPEVETTLAGIQPFLKNAHITDIVVRNTSMRWPVPVTDLQTLIGEPVLSARRRAKYILIEAGKGTILLHLGMSGNLRALPNDVLAGKHDHLDIELNNTTIIRLNDPRRFGCCLFTRGNVMQHKLLANLGPEPLLDAFNGEYLFARSRQRKVPVKNFIMDGAVVVGVGNIYASESLFMAGIRPTLQAHKVSQRRYALLAKAIKSVLAKAIQAGGTTLNDFTQVDGKPGYFRHELQVYGRANQPCKQCSKPIKSQVIGQRNTFYCMVCQTF